MSPVPNLADPDVEPTDEELEGLMKRAFAEVRAQNAAVQERIRAEIAAEREQVRARLRSAGRLRPSR